MIRDHEIVEHLRKLVAAMDELRRIVRTQKVIQHKVLRELNNMSLAVNLLVERLKAKRV